MVLTLELTSLRRRLPLELGCLRVNPLADPSATEEHHNLKNSWEKIRNSIHYKVCITRLTEQVDKPHSPFIIHYLGHPRSPPAVRCPAMSREMSLTATKFDPNGSTNTKSAERFSKRWGIENDCTKIGVSKPSLSQFNIDVGSPVNSDLFSNYYRFKRETKFLTSGGDRPSLLDLPPFGNPWKASALIIFASFQGALIR